MNTFPPLVSHLMAFVTVLCHKPSTFSLFRPSGDHAEFTNLWRTREGCYQLLDQLPLLLMSPPLPLLLVLLLFVLLS